MRSNRVPSHPSMRTTGFSNLATRVLRVLLVQVLLQTLLISMTTPVNGHALQVYAGQKTRQLSHLRSRRSPLTSLEPPRTFPYYHCESKTFTPQSWKELQIDSYLISYPNGLNVSLQGYARIHGVLNFECGLNQFCAAGPLCSPIVGRAWWVLAAVQIYNEYQNSLFTAIGMAASQAKAIGTHLVNDLYPQDAKKKFRLFQSIAMILTMTLAVVAMIAAAVFGFVPGLTAFAVMAAAGAVVAIAQVTAVMKAHAAEVEAAQQDTFTKWATYVNLIADWQSQTQNEVARITARTLEYPIGSTFGIQGVLKGGEYIRNTTRVDTHDLEAKMSRMLTIRMAGQILRAKKAFVVIGVGCQGSNEALPLADGWLSYCDKANGLMMNVIYDKDGKSGNQIYNARVLVERYNITAEYIVKQSVECAKISKEPDHDPYDHGTIIPQDENSPCLIGLPVCNTTEDAVHKMLKHHTTPKACRVAGHISLP